MLEYRAQVRPLRLPLAAGDEKPFAASELRVRSL
jgi:hypothetical protein